MDYYKTKIKPFPRGWKAVRFTFAEKPRGMNQWFNALWGWGIWYYNVPVVKTLLICNILIWAIFLI